MQTRVWAAAALLCSAGTGWAQPSVTVFGFIDVAIGKDTGRPNKALLDEYDSRIGFKGEEDLGGGLSASFYLEHRLDPQTGAEQGPFWKGGSWVGLGGPFGKVMLGRWWSQAFLKSQFASDPFGMGTVAEDYGTVGCDSTMRYNCVGAFWVDNSVTYEFSAGGFSFGAQVASRPAASALIASPKIPFNVGLSYQDGPLYLAFGHESHESVYSAAGAGGEAVWNHTTVNYDFGSVKLISGYGTGHDNDRLERRNVVVGFTAPVGAGTLIGAYNRHRIAGVTTVSHASLGYQYALSKRTTLYTTLSNDDKAATSRSGYDLGILHRF